MYDATYYSMRVLSTNEKNCKLTFIITPVILLATMVAISVMVSEDAFGRDRYSTDSTSQAAAVSNDCLNPMLDSNTIDNMVSVGNCGGTVSQQDESGQAGATTTHQTSNPTVELQRSTTTSQPGLGAPMTCEECFDILSATQETAVEQVLAGPNNPLDDELWGANPPTTIEELCAMWATFNMQQRGQIADGDITELLDGVATATQVEVIRCLNASPFAPAG
jgi:hypothetical protein